MPNSHYNVHISLNVYADADKMAKAQIDRIEGKIKKMLDVEVEKLKKKHVVLEFEISPE